MKPLLVCACLLKALSVCAVTEDSGAQFGFDSKAITPDVEPGFTMFSSDGFQGKRILQPVGFGELEISFPMPFTSWDFNTGGSFALNFMNSSWRGLADTSTYQRGEPIYLQATASAVPDHELYIRSCYVTPSPDPADKSRYALILNQGCVSSKRSVMKFHSRQSDSINLVLNTSDLKFSQVHVHCGVALSRYGLSPDAKSCNYNTNTSRWVELGGQTSVCDCCSTRCRKLPHSRTPHEFTVLVSTGPASIVDQLQGKPSVGSSDAGVDWLASGATPPSIDRGWIVSEKSVVGSLENVLNVSPWLSQPASADVMVMNQDIGEALSLWLPGLMVDVRSNPVFKVEIGSAQSKGSVDLGVPGPRKSYAETSFLGDTGTEEPLKLSVLTYPSQELVDVADALDLKGEELKSSDHTLEDFEKDLQEDQLRGDVFMNFSPHSAVGKPSTHVLPFMADDSIFSLKNEVPEKTEGDEVVVLTRTEVTFKRLKDLQLQPLKSSKLTLPQNPHGSRSIDYKEQQSTPSMAVQEVRKAQLDPEKGDWVGEKEQNQQGTEKELVRSLLDLLRGLNVGVYSV